MNNPLLSFISLMLLSLPVFSETIPLSVQPAKDLSWTTKEKQFFAPKWNTEVITNVSQPELLVYTPKSELANGVGVIIAPGGGFYGLSIKSEGTDVAEWLASRGVTAFVLKYRLIPTGVDGTKDQDRDRGTEAGNRKLDAIMPLAYEDVLVAMKTVRQRMKDFGIQPGKMGLVGFSAGGNVAMSLVYTNDPLAQVDFVGAIYPWMDPLKGRKPAANSAPLFIATATDDDYMVPQSINLYRDWVNAGLSAEMRLYRQGGHGFGMRTNNIPTDKWIEEYYAWLMDVLK